MSEYIITDEGIEAERRQAYEAGKRNRDVWTAKVYHGEQIVRCRDCRHYSPQDGTTWPECLWFGVAFRDDDDNGFCAWGKEKVEQ